MGEQFDIAVIGAGPGGYVAAIRAAQLGFKVCCIDKGNTLGGTCLNVGCIPSKSLLYSSEKYQFLQHNAKEHGIEFKELSFDFNQMMGRKDKVIAGLVNGIEGLFRKNKINRIIGSACFVSSNKVEVSNNEEKKEIEAKNFIVATGSEPIPLPFLPFDEKQVVSSTGCLSLSQVPKKLLLVGSGVIGVELASVYSRLGSEVTVIEMLDRICPSMDESISKTLLQILKKQNINFHLGTEVLKGKAAPDHVALIINQNKQTVVLTADVALIAIGRRPFTQGLGLEEIKVNVDKRGFIEVDSNFRTSIPSIYAIGDVIPGAMLAHKASEEGVSVAEIIAGIDTHVNYMTIPNIIYTSPEAAGVGFTEQEAKQAGLQVLVGTFPFRANARARCCGEEDGFVKVIGDAKSGRLIGMHIINSHASELIHEGVFAIDRQCTLEDIARTCHGHPTYSEATKEAALAALGRIIHL